MAIEARKIEDSRNDGGPEPEVTAEPQLGGSWGAGEQRDGAVDMSREQATA